MYIDRHKPSHAQLEETVTEKDVKYCVHLRKEECIEEVITAKSLNNLEQQQVVVQETTFGIVTNDEKANTIQH